MCIGFIVDTGLHVKRQAEKKVSQSSEPCQHKIALGSLSRPAIHQKDAKAVSALGALSRRATHKKDRKALSAIQSIVETVHTSSDGNPSTEPSKE